jgi:hydroxyacyl-ACP dehydratase HTD2-like protein with hotdog domain
LACLVFELTHVDAYPTRQLTWSPVGLFRFSALTFNGHKIHYDAGWSQGIEGHPGVVVHGPLNLINMLDYWRDVHGGESAAPAGIAYRALAPLYAGDAYTIQTGGVADGVFDIAAEKNGTVCVKAQITGR